jgi:hypothetical protein
MSSRIVGISQQRQASARRDDCGHRVNVRGKTRTASKYWCGAGQQSSDVEQQISVLRHNDLIAWAAIGLRQ